MLYIFLMAGQSSKKITKILSTSLVISTILESMLSGSFLSPVMVSHHVTALGGMSND